MERERQLFQRSLFWEDLWTEGPGRLGFVGMEESDVNLAKKQIHQTFRLR